MSFTTITEEQQSNMGVSGLPDTPELDTSDMQAKFDELGNAAIDLLQTHITELEASNACTNIGCTAPADIAASEATVQSVLNAIARLAVSNHGSAHTHANKEVLDAITQAVKDTYDSIASVFGTVQTFDTDTLVSSALSVPSSKAVATYVTAFNIAQKLLVQVYPVGSIYIGSSSPAVFLGGTWVEVADTGLSSDYTTWKRTA